MTAIDLKKLRHADLCTMPGDFQDDLLKAGVNKTIAHDMSITFLMSKVNGQYNFMEFVFNYCINDQAFQDAIILYINSFPGVQTKTI